MSTYIVLNTHAWTNQPAVILTDFLYWAEHETELLEWCNHSLKQKSKAFEGTMVLFENDKELLLFTLRWG